MDKINEGYYALTTATVTKDEKRGTYRVQYRLYGSDGSTQKTSCRRGFRTQREAKAYVESLTREHAEAEYKQDHPDLAMTFAELYERYKIARIVNKPTTQTNRDYLVQKHILPFWGQMQIREITEDAISHWHATFYDADGAPIYKATYLRSMHSRLSAVLNYAKQCGWIEKNPSSTCSIGAKNADERPVWTIAEYSRFRHAIEDAPVEYYAFETFYFTGLRLGELLALTIDDIDLDRRTIRVTKNLQTVKGKEMILTPKTPKSIRTVRINAALADELREYIVSLPTEGRVFPTTRDRLRRVLRRGTEAAGLNPISIHCFRHSHITNLISAGFSPTDIGKRVGHESVYITLHYAHALQEAEDRMADTLDSMMEAMN